MNKFSTKLKQKQSIVPQQIIKSRLLELSIDELEKDLENEIQINPVLEEKSIEESNTSNHSDPFLDQSSYDLFLANIPEIRNVTDDLITQIDTSEFDEVRVRPTVRDLFLGKVVNLVVSFLSDATIRGVVKLFKLFIATSSNP